MTQVDDIPRNFFDLDKGVVTCPDGHTQDIT